MWRSAGRTAPGGRCLLEPQNALDLGELGVGVQQHGSAPDDDVDAEPIADGHLVDQPSEIELKLGDARGKMIAPAAQVDASLVARRQRSRQ